ncbi:SMI1/KNR4 family protein [Cellulomonas alba]|uniref:Knr4/Smi1-like domain-containing protein n=1 Tax=Cellulomonas alba TaxID=3053467 RepID=A0ABT7SH33_9CELL|nr:SMI1/KNR4 family protein [Cellulomonas alba]MDM7855491.1 hypothetical protein [Cellulomonas alba]
MSIERALARFESVIGAAWPEPFGSLRPGLADAEIEELSAAVRPFVLPRQVEALYRWRGGGDAGVFGGWRMRSPKELISWYRFTTSKLEQPRTWLPVFDDQIVNVVTLDTAGEEPSDPSVWYGHTHDAYVSRLFDSVEALLDVVCDAAEAGVLSETQPGSLRLAEVESLDGRAWTELRLRRCPGAFRWPDPPPGTYLGRFTEPAWPRPWLAAVGITDESLTLRGRTHTIAELIAAAASGPVTGTIRGQVVTGSGGLGWWSPVVTDGSAELIVYCDTKLVPIAPTVGQEAEFDVLLSSAEKPEPSADDDPQIAAIANRFRPSLPTAVANAARPARP